MISLQGGIAEFAQSLTNNASGQITGHGTIKTGTGLTNLGTINLSGGATDVYGAVTNSNKITITGGGTTTFYGSVDTSAAAGMISVGTNTTAVFFGPVTGAGSLHFGGAGIKDFESTFSGPAIDSAIGDTYVGTPATVTTQFFNEDDVQISGSAAMTPGGSQSLASRVHTLAFLDTGKLDLNEHDLIVDYTGASPLAAIFNQIKTGYNNGNWSGNQLTSSAAHAASLTAHPTAGLCRGIFAGLERLRRPKR